MASSICHLHPARLRTTQIQHLQGEPVRRLAVTTTVLALSTVGLAACGGTDSTDTGKVTVSGAFGTAPKVTYDGTLSRDKTEVKVLAKGTGATVAEGDSAYVEYYIGN